jgi:hypothetical protein
MGKWQTFYQKNMQASAGTTYQYVRGFVSGFVGAAQHAAEGSKIFPNASD